VGNLWVFLMVQGRKGGYTGKRDRIEDKTGTSAS
jgi:hypothetical protein